MRINLVQKITDWLRKKDKKAVLSFKKSNQLLLPSDFDYKKLHIGIIGKNNIIKIADGVRIIDKLSINGYVDNSVIEICENFCCGDLLLQLGQNHKNFGKIKNCKIKVGANSGWESGKIVTYNSNTFVEIGADCMFAGNVTLYNTDAHPIYDVKTGLIVNKVKGIFIGNHVWLGMNSTVLKNSFVPDNSIVGWNAVFSGCDKTKTNCVFVGNPACCVKESVTWDKNGSGLYIENEL